MATTIEYDKRLANMRNEIWLPRWERISLLSILGYEAAGCLAGGFLLSAAPDGRLMVMPVDMMHGAFPNFLIPGIILFGLGILTTLAFISVLRRTRSDWLMAGLALGGLFIWFWVEIAILRELHWLHAMWGIPVFLGWVVAVPLIASRHSTVAMRKPLLLCGIISSLWYLSMNIVVPFFYEGYSSAAQTVSELSAIGAPTRILWTLLGLLYPMFFMAFGWGVRQSASENRHLRIVGSLIIIYSILTLYWPPMHMREVTAAGGGTLSDTLHISWAMMTLLFNIVLMGFGAAALGKGFRIYTVVSFAAFIVFGILIAIEAPGVQPNLPTPWIGFWERANISVFQLWVIVFTITLLREIRKQGSNKVKPYIAVHNLSRMLSSQEQ